MAKSIRIHQGVGTFEEVDDRVGTKSVELPEGIQGDLLSMDDVLAEAPVAFAQPPPSVMVDQPQTVTVPAAVQTGTEPTKNRRGRPKSPTKKRVVVSKPPEAPKLTPKKRNMYTVVSLLIPPILISFISALHMYEFFLMANPPFMAIVLAISYEILNIAVLVAIWQFSIMSKGTRTFIWTALFVLVALLIVGNCYANYLHLDPEAISKFAAQWGLPNDVTTSRVLALLHGSLLPLTTVAFVKAVANYWLKTEGKS